MAVNRLVGELANGHITYEGLKVHYREIDSRLQDDLGFIHFMVLEERDVQYIELADVPLFGQQTADRFPSISYEVSEAGKCLAFERSTASVFHSVRCLEAAIKAISRCLGIPDPLKAADRSWFKMLAAVKQEIDRRWPSPADRSSGDGRFFEEGHAALAAMQNPWRNATMHLDQKYTPEEARHILEVVKGFMKRLASRCDEEGKPLA